MNLRAVLAPTALALLAACATTSTQSLAPAPPVKVVVTAAPSLGKLIDVATMTSETELALRRFAPAATPATVTVNLSRITLQPALLPIGAESHGNPEPVMYRQIVPSLSQMPSFEGAEPVIATYTEPAQTFAPGMQVVVQGTYSIVDANGVTLETSAISLEPGRDHQPFAATLAKRVAKLVHGS